MYQIMLIIQRARSKRDPDKPGKVHLKVFERIKRADGSFCPNERSIDTGVPMPVGGQLSDLRDELIPYVYNAYLVIENLRNSGSEFTIDDIAQRLRTMIGSDGFRPRVSDDFVWNSEVATLKKELIPWFRYNKQYRKKAVSEEPETNTDSLLGFLQHMSRRMLSEGRESMFSSFMTTRSSLERFLDSEDIPLAEVDHYFVEDYAEWLKENGVADSTQSFYLRTLRAAVNYAVKDGVAELDTNMFRNVNTKVVYDRIVNKNDCLSREAVLKIANMDLSGLANLDLARDMFMFGFYCRGMELTDIMDLTTENLNGDELTYRRRGNGKEVTQRLDSQAMAILKKYENRRHDFLFPLKTSSLIKLDKGLKYKVAKWLEKLGEMVDLESLTFNMNITTWNHMMSQVNLPAVMLGL